MPDFEELRDQVQNTCNMTVKYPDINLARLPQTEPPDVDVRDTIDDYKAHQGMLAAQLRGEKRAVQRVHR